MLVVFALIPLLVALLLLLLCQWNSRDVGWVTLAVAIVLVSLVPAFHLAPWQIALSLGEGTVTMLSVSILLFPALLFSQMQQETGALDILLEGITRFFPDRIHQMLLLILGVGPALLSLGGSGLGVVIIAPLLLRLHEKKLKALQLSVLSQILAAWVSWGEGIMLAANLAGLAVETLSLYTALLLFPATIGSSIMVLLLSGGRKAVQQYWSIAIGASVFFLSAASLCSVFSRVEMSGVLAGGSVMILLLIWRHPRCNVSLPGLVGKLNISNELPLLSALLPYFLLVAGLFATQFLPSPQLSLHPPDTLIYPALTFHLTSLSRPGVWLLLAALAHIPLFSLRKGCIKRMNGKIWKQFLPIALVMVSFLSTAALMQKSGMVEGLGDTVGQLGQHSAWVAPLLGGIGGWLTGANVSGNALMVPMQKSISSQTALPLLWLIAVQNTSTAFASAASPIHLLLLATVTGLLGKEALLLRKIGLLLLWPLVLTTLLFLWLIASSWLFLSLLLIAVNAPILLVIVKGRTGWTNWRRTLPVFVPLPKQIRHLPVGRWFLRSLAYGGLLLSNVLYASSALVLSEPISRIDPVLFLSFQMLLLIPIESVFLLIARRQLNRAAFHRGFWLGGLLSTGLLCYTLSLKGTGITQTMVFAALNGVIATLIAWKVFGQHISTLTRWACLLAFFGAGLVWFASLTKWQGNATAFVSGVLLTGYSFQVEQFLADVKQRKQPILPVLGVQFLTMTLATIVIALMFGHWQTVQFLLPSDFVALVYLSQATILLPCLLLLLTQRYVSAVTVAFFNVIEPLAGVGMAFVYAGERLPALVYLGGGVVLFGVILQILSGTIEQKTVSTSREPAVPSST